jgi:SMC interacting uncharacterized protein involved in chromosome segregation
MQAAQVQGTQYFTSTSQAQPQPAGNKKQQQAAVQQMAQYLQQDQYQQLGYNMLGQQSQPATQRNQYM